MRLNEHTFILQIRFPLQENVTFDFNLDIMILDESSLAMFPGNG